MLDLILDDVDTIFCKNHVETKDINTINPHLANKRELQMRKNEKPLVVDIKSLDFPT